MDSSLTWDDSYAIARALIAKYPQVDPENVSLGMVYRWTVELPEFNDDVEFVNDGILTSIHQEWFEEVNKV